MAVDTLLGCAAIFRGGRPRLLTWRVETEAPTPSWQSFSSALRRIRPVAIGSKFEACISYERRGHGVGLWDDAPTTPRPPHAPKFPLGARSVINKEMSSWLPFSCHREDCRVSPGGDHRKLSAVVLRVRQRVAHPTAFVAAAQSHAARSHLLKHNISPNARCSPLQFFILEKFSHT